MPPWGDYNLPALQAAEPLLSQSAERNCLVGVSADWAGQWTDSLAVPQSALPLPPTAHPAQAGIAPRTIADDGAKTFQFAQAARAEDELVKSYPGQFLPEQRQNARDDARLLPLLAGAPAQTIRWSAPVAVPTTATPIGLIAASLDVNGMPHD